MTAVFLSGGAGVALADSPTLPTTTPISPAAGGVDSGPVCDLVDTATGALKTGSTLPTGVSLEDVLKLCPTDDSTKQPTQGGKIPDRGGRGDAHQDGRKDRHHQGKDASHDKDCGCAKDDEHDKDGKDSKDKHKDDHHAKGAKDAKDCDTAEPSTKAPEKSPEKSPEKAPEKSSEKSDSPAKVASEESPEKTVDIPSDSDVEAESTSPKSTEDTAADTTDSDSPEVQNVANTSTPESNEQVSAVPTGSADTGDGSSMLSFGPVAPVAAQGSTSDELALAGGAAAALLLGGYGVRMARHRRVGAHRS